MDIDVSAICLNLLVISSIVLDFLEGLKGIQIQMMTTRCLFQKRARSKILKRLEGLRQRLVEVHEDALYMRDLIFEIQVLRCNDCKVTSYRDGSWIHELCDIHSAKEKEL